MELKSRIEADMKAALKAGDKRRLGAIRLLVAAIRQREVDERRSMADADVLAILDKARKQRLDSASQYDAANRPELAEQERYEIAVLEGYLPQPLTPAEIDALIAGALVATAPQSPKDLGKVMAWLKPHVQGRADLGALSARVKDQLAPV